MKKLTLKIERDKTRLTYVSSGITITDLHTRNSSEFVNNEEIHKSVLYRLSSEKDLQFSSRVANDICTVLTWEN